MDHEVWFILVYYLSAKTSVLICDFIFFALKSYFSNFNS